MQNYLDIIIPNSLFGHGLVCMHVLPNCWSLKDVDWEDYEKGQFVRVKVPTSVHGEVVLILVTWVIAMHWWALLELGNGWEWNVGLLRSHT